VSGNKWEKDKVDVLDGKVYVKEGSKVLKKG